MTARLALCLSASRSTSLILCVFSSYFYFLVCLHRYQRSWEGSACVFLSSILFVSCFWYTFESATQFWLALALLPPAMSYAEATSPHTIDTPFLMGVGGVMLYLISHLHVEWVK